MFLAQFTLVSMLGLVSVFVVTLVLVAPLVNVVLVVLMDHFSLFPEIYASVRKLTWAEAGFVHALSAFLYSLLITVFSIWRRTWLLRNGDDYIADLLGAHRIIEGMDEADLVRVQNVTLEMAMAAGIPPPRLRLWTTFATANLITVGRGPSDSSIFISRLALRALTRDELQAMIAYGIGQIVNGDTALLTRIAAYRGALRWPADVAWNLLTARGGRNMVENAIFWLLFGLPLGLLLGSVAFPLHFASKWLQRKFNAERQHLADATALQFTRNPQAAIGALVKATALGGGSLPLKPLVRDLGQASFVPLPGLRTSDHLTIIERVQAISPSFSEAQIREMQREANRRHEREEAERARVQREKRRLLSRDPTPGATAAERLASMLALQQIARAEQEKQAHQRRLNEQRHLAADAARAREEAADLAGDRRQQIEARHFETVSRLIAAVESYEPDARQDARAVVLSLLVDRSPEVKRGQLDYLRSKLPESEHPALIRAIHGHRALPHDERVAVLQGWLPRLRELPQAEQRRALALIRDLEQLDEHTDVFEYGLARMAAGFLSDVLTTRQPHGDRWLIRCAPAAQVALSVVAQFTAKTRAGAAFEAGAKRLGMVSTLEYSPQLRWTSSLDAALDTLDELMPQEKARLLDAAQVIAAFEAGISDEERELIRVVAVTLHCPVPRIEAG